MPAVVAVVAVYNVFALCDVSVCSKQISFICLSKICRLKVFGCKVSSLSWTSQNLQHLLMNLERCQFWKCEGCIAVAT